MGANTAPLALGKGAASPECLYPTLLLITGGAKIPGQEAFRLRFHNLCFCPGGLGVPALLPFSQGLGLAEGLSSTAMTLLFFFARFPCSGVRGGLFQAQISTWSGLKPPSSHDMEKPISLSWRWAAGAGKWYDGHRRAGVLLGKTFPACAGQKDTREDFSPVSTSLVAVSMRLPNGEAEDGLKLRERWIRRVSLLVNVLCP